MILLQSHSRFLFQTLLNRAQNLEKGVELDHHWVEFDDVRYHIQVSMKNPHVLLLSVSLPTPSSETIFVCGLPFGAIEAIKAAYGNLVQILDPPRDGFNLTLKINLSKLPANQGCWRRSDHMGMWEEARAEAEGFFSSFKVAEVKPLQGARLPWLDPDSSHSVHDFKMQHNNVNVAFPCRFTTVMSAIDNIEQKHAFLVKVASIREVVLGAPLRVILEHLAARTVAPDLDPLVALVHRPNESFFLFPQADKVTVVYPMRFNDSIDIVLATSFLQEFVEARRTAGLNNTPPCSWSLTPPLELKEVPAANAGFVTFVIFPRHVEGQKLDRTVWNLSTFHAYVSYHVKLIRTAVRQLPLTQVSILSFFFMASASNNPPPPPPLSVNNVVPVNHMTPEILKATTSSVPSDASANLEATSAECSEGFMHTRMRRRVESLIQALNRAKPDVENSKKTSYNRSFKRLSQGFKDQLIFIKRKHGEEDILLLLDYTITNQGVAIACLQNVPDACF
ncbi:hypothetical protein JHK84_045001 [Glycine max]|nr:hypothetical protein JHK84_045001 [Glycine max]